MSLFNTPHKPYYQNVLAAEARKAKAYHNGSPYPAHAFKEWKSEKRGSLPLCQPFVREIVGKGARWLFGRPISFVVDGDDIEKSERVNEIWNKCGMPRRAVAMAETAAQTGGVFLKWWADGEEVRIECFDAAEQVRLYYDPHDSDRLEMLRIQYPYFNPEDGAWYLVREEYTDEQIATYAPKPISGEPTENWTLADSYSYASTMKDDGKWPDPVITKNAYGIIPGVLVKNIDKGMPYGWGDLWGLWPAIDRINFTMELANHDNQLSIHPKRYLLNARLKDEDDGDALSIGDDEYLDPDSPDHPVDIKWFEAKGAIREPLQGYADCLMEHVYKAAGSALIRADEITNKGNLTKAVMALLYEPLIEQTEEKRKSYGEGGVCAFFERMALGLANAGIKDPLASKGPIDVQAKWPDYFDLTEEEELARVNRLALMVDKRFTTPERAVEELAAGANVGDLDQLKKDIEALPEPDPAENAVGEEKNGD